MHECNFCAKNYDETKGGFTIFMRDGGSIHYCTRKCLKNAKMGRTARKLKWTAKGAKK